MDLPFDIPERIQFSDEGYSVLGRALAFATDFEGNCRNFASIIGLKDEPSILQDEKSINKFCMFLEKRKLFAHLKTITDKYKITEDGNTALKKGREARNYIAHEAGLGLKHILENDDSKMNFLNDIEIKVRDIAGANLLILLMSKIETNEPIYTLAPVVQGYVDRVVQWVCEEE